MSTSRGCTIIFVQFVHIIVILPHSHSHSSNKNRSVPLSFSPALWWCRLPCVFFCARGLKRPEAAFFRRNFSNQNKGHLGSRATIFSVTPSERCVSRFMSPCKRVLCTKHSTPFEGLKNYDRIHLFGCDVNYEKHVRWISQILWTSCFFPKTVQVALRRFFANFWWCLWAKGSLRKAYFVRNSSILYLPPFA